jgi:hypothetical protein
VPTSDRKPRDQAAFLSQCKFVLYFERRFVVPVHHGQMARRTQDLQFSPDKALDWRFDQ